MKINRYILLMGALLGTICLRAQVAASYSCDFEDSVQNQTWVLTNGDDAKSIPNKWYIGSAVSNTGMQSLYISADTNKTACYVAHSSYAVAHTNQMKYHRFQH